MFVETFSGAWGAEGAPCFCYTLYVLIGEVRNNMGTTNNRAKKEIGRQAQRLPPVFIICLNAIYSG